MDNNPRILTISDCRECAFSEGTSFPHSGGGLLEIRCAGVGRTIGCRRIGETVPIPNWCPLLEADETFDQRVIAATDAARKEASNGQS